MVCKIKSSKDCQEDSCTDLVTINEKEAELLERAGLYVMYNHGEAYAPACTCRIFGFIYD